MTTTYDIDHDTAIERAIAQIEKRKKALSWRASHEVRPMGAAHLRHRIDGLNEALIILRTGKGL